MQEPIAKKIPRTLIKHNDTRIDNYFWMNRRDDENVIDYLKEENDYYDHKTSHTKPLQKALFEEMKARIKEDDLSVPYKYNGYWYVTRFEKGEEYPIYTRKKETREAEEEILFDCNVMAEGKDFFQMGSVSISPDNRYAVFTVDTIGRRIYTLQIKDLGTGEIFPEKIEQCAGGGIAWAEDNKTFFYTKQNAETLRSEKIYKHKLGSTPESDELVYFEEDDTFNTYVFKTKSQKYILIASSSSLTTEYRILESDRPDGTFRIFQKRQRGLEYGVEHYEDHFYVLSNDNAINFKLSKTPRDKTEKSYWQDIIPHREDTLLEDMDIFHDHLVVSERNQGLNKIRIIRWDGTEDYYLPFENETYTAYTTTNPDFNTDTLRYGYTSLTTPNSVIDFDMVSRKKNILKTTEVLGGDFYETDYASERLWATTDDGTKVAISIVYKKDVKKDGGNPLVLYGYGSYGHTVDPTFSSMRLSLLNRGFIFAIAHIRGGEYLGRPWYENGKLLHKKNTFTDFISCAKHLIKNGYTSTNHCYAIGGSAGGLLMGVIANAAPMIFNGIVAEVPFVDVVTTMLDESIPLTTGEYDEWGNPNDKEFYDYIKSYSPYDNVKDQDYPNMLVRTGYHDSQVQYWEPAKWVAKLRSHKTDNNTLLFHIDMTAGHSGVSGRFQAIKEIAEVYSFLLSLEDISV